MKWALIIALAACGDAPKELVVTVDADPSVHDVATLHVTLSNAGGTVSQDLDLGSHAFPVTFGVQAPGRSGDLGIQVDALDTNKLIVGTGTGTGDITGAAATVKLAGADFVVNSEFAGDQILADDYEAYGFQLSASDDGTWFAGYHTGDCFSTPCPQMGRRFDATGKAIESDESASSQSFAVSLTSPSGSPNMALAPSKTTTVTVWDAEDTTTSMESVQCRSFDGTGKGQPAQHTLATESSIDVVSAAPLSNQNVAVAWYAFGSTESVRGAMVRPDCTVAIGPFQVNTTTTAQTTHRPTVGVSGETVMYAWIADGNVRIRLGTNAGVSGTDTQLFAATTTQMIDMVRVVPWAGMFAVMIRWAPLSGPGATHLDLYKVDKTGKVVSGPTVITTGMLMDFETAAGFGAAQRADGALLITWDDCDAGDGNGCGVFGRVVRPSGVPVGPAAVIPTTITSDQAGPSVVALPSAWAVAWTDKSAADPDHAGLAVRARIYSPAYDDASGIEGGACPCGTGLACGMGSDGMQRCFQTCQPPMCPNGGSCMSGTDGTNVCIY